MKRSVQAILVLALLTALGGSAGAVAPRPGPGDSRIHIVDYDPEQVVELKATLGYQMSVELGPAERIESIAIGDSVSWQVTPNRRGNIFFLKPMANGPDTNMTVLTNLRSYYFQLSAQPKSRKQVPLVSVRFVYPAPAFAVVAPPPPPEPEKPKEQNTAYSYTGSIHTLPVRVFDDGEQTYFDFKTREDRPAIYAVDPEGQEAVINARQRDGLVIVDRIARSFVLRRGSEVTTIYNDAFPAPEPSTLKERPKKSWWSRQ